MTLRLPSVILLNNFRCQGMISIKFVRAIKFLQAKMGGWALGSTQGREQGSGRSSRVLGTHVALTG